MSDFTITDAIREEVDAAVVCWLATVSAEGEPNVSPKELWAIYDDTSLVVANIASPVTQRNLQSSGRACLSFIDVFRQKGFKLTGAGTYYPETDDAFPKLAASLLEVAGEAFKVKGVFYIKPAVAAPIIAPSYYVHGRSEAEMVAQSHETYGVREK